jgi:transcription antitermination factor NusG
MGQCVYAVQVITGQENRTRKILEIILSRYPELAVIIEKIYAFEYFNTRIKRQGKKSKMHDSVKSAVPGYIFIELKPDLMYFPPKLWHIVKSVPGVIRVLDRWYETGAPAKYSGYISKEEFQTFVNNVEDGCQVEIVSDEIVDREKLQEERDKKEKEVLHQINTGKYPQKENKSYFEDNRETIGEQAEHIFAQKDNASDILKRQLEKCRVFLKRKREIISMPAKLFNAFTQNISEMIFGHENKPLDPKTSMSELMKENRLLRIFLDMLSYELSWGRGTECA